MCSLNNLCKADYFSFLRKSIFFCFSSIFFPVSSCFCFSFSLIVKKHTYISWSSLFFGFNYQIMNTINLNKNIHTVLHWKTKNAVDRIVYNYTQFTFLEKQDNTFVCLNKNGCTVWPMSLWASNIAMQGHIKGCIFKQKTRVN